MKVTLSRLVAGVSVSSLAIGVVLSAQMGGGAPSTKDYNVGNWRLNVSKSTFVPGPPIKSQTLKIESWGDDGVKVTSDGVDADGKPMRIEFRAKYYERKDVPVKGSTEFDTVVYERLRATKKLKGQVVGTERMTVSDDGKTRTIVQTGTNAKGEKFENTLVYDKR